MTTNGVVDNKCGTSGGGIPGDAKSLGTGENVESRMLPPTCIQWAIMYNLFHWQKKKLKRVIPDPFINAAAALLLDENLQDARVI